MKKIIHYISALFIIAGLGLIMTSGCIFGSGGEEVKPITRSGDVNYVTNVEGDFAIGGTDSNAAFWFDKSAGDLTVTGDLNASGYASTTLSLNTQGSLHIGGSGTLDGEFTSTGSTTASIINMTTVKFTPSATPTPVVTGECFMDNTDYQLNCYNGTDWQYVW